MAIFTLVLMVIENLIATYRTHPLYLKETIYIGNRRIEPSSILGITELSEGTHGKYRTIEFQIEEGENTIKLRVLPKPVFIFKDLKGCRSKTLQTLLDHYPALRDKTSL
ncbi:MAG: hypothetical protein ACFB15_16715 [Cyclobacteriaceae bacterium]